MNLLFNKIFASNLIKSAAITHIYLIIEATIISDGHVKEKL